MRFSYVFFLAVVLALVALGSAPVGAAGTVEATSIAELSDDPGFEGLWHYTILMSWDLEDYDLGHLDFFLAMDAFRDTCIGDEIVFPTPAGTSSGVDPFGSLCQLDYTGVFQCKTDPSLKLGDLGYSIKYEPVEGQCETDTQGSGIFHFYTNMAPGISGLHEDALAVKHGQDIDFGNVQGQLPHMDGFSETGRGLINEFLVRPGPGSSEFVEVYNPGTTPLDLSGWEIVINEENVIPLEGTIPSGGHLADSTILAAAKIDFDFYPDTGGSIASGTPVNSAYWPLGVGFYKGGGTTCGSGSDVYANDDQPAGFGSPPNVVSTCPDGIASDISEGFGFGYINAYFNADVRRVCIEVHPVGPTDQAVLRAYGSNESFLGEVYSTPGATETLCFETLTDSIGWVEFSGRDTSFCRFDNMTVVPQPPPFVIAKGGALGTDGSQINGNGNGHDLVPDKGGIIVLYDDNGMVQDSIAYGNMGGAPISAPLLVRAGTAPPPGFKEPGYVAAENETLSTSTQRILDGLITGSFAGDFNVAKPTPNYTNNGDPNDAVRDSVFPDGRGDIPLHTNSVPPPALGSGIRLNTVYAFGRATDGIGLYNPTTSTFNLAGWHVSDGSIIEPVFGGGGDMPLGPTGATELMQNMPESFTFELESDDVLYLYDENLVRLDQLGWTRVPTFFPDSCLLRNPDGVGPADGYDWNTSGGLDGTLIYDTCPLQQTVAILPQGQPFQTALAAPYPNPARGASTVSFTIGGAGERAVPADIVIYDVAGRRVRTLMRGEFKPGIYRAVWNGLRDSGTRAAAGVYFVRMRVDNEPFGEAKNLVWLR